MNRKQRRTAEKSPESVKDLEGICPGCGRNFAFGSTTSGPDRRPFVLHAMPMCADFEKREPIEYLAWINDVRDAEERAPISE